MPRHGYRSSPAVSTEIRANFPAAGSRVWEPSCGCAALVDLSAVTCATTGLPRSFRSYGWIVGASSGEWCHLAGGVVPVLNGTGLMRGRRGSVGGAGIPTSSVQIGFARRAALRIWLPSTWASVSSISFGATGTRRTSALPEEGAHTSIRVCRFGPRRFRPSAVAAVLRPPRRLVACW